MVVVPLLAWFTAGWMLGWASAPYDPAWARQWPRRAALMALAGPAANLILVLAAALLIRVGMEWQVFTAPTSIGSMRLTEAVSAGPWEIVATVLSVMLALNLLLCIFNLLPFPPLDGSSIPLLVLPAHLAEKYATFMRNPMLQLAGFLIASRVLGPLFPSLLGIVSNLLYPGTRYR